VRFPELLVTPPLSRHVLTVNRGSATLKCALYESRAEPTLLVSAIIEQVGPSQDHLKITDAGGKPLFDGSLGRGDSDEALDAILSWLAQHGFLSQLAAVGHRLVQGGPQHTKPERITPKFLTDLEQLVELDPDHLPSALRGIRFISAKFPELPQVACFDTQFHSGLPEVARRYALPQRLYEERVFRYGFHGLSYEFVMSELQRVDGKLVSGRIIIAHLGSGASVVAVKAGSSIDTSMGFTPLEGLVMSTRSGDVDPGAMLYLMSNKNIAAKEMSRLLNTESGLLGVSGKSGEMRVLLDRMSEDADCATAVELFCYRAKKYIGAYVAALGGLDALVFAGGIGEHAPAIRQQICEGLEFLGIVLEPASNESNASLLSPAGNRVQVRIVETNEDLMIARHVREVLGWIGA
jgi:acetate kinase